MTSAPADLAALAAGGKAALARCLSSLEAVPDDPRLAALLDAAWAAPHGRVVGLTGPPGVGKSTLIGALIAQLRTAGETVAVIAVDPSSRKSGGALLGDRTRIETDPGDAGAFVRSMAARRRLGGLADLTFPAIVLMRALFDWILVETVGIGQSESEIADCADMVALCVQPGAGDALQFMKAGIMEVPDLVLVTKGDLGAPAARAAADARGALSLAAGGPPPQVAVVSALNGEGVAAATDMLRAAFATLESGPGLAARRRAQGRAWVESRLVESFGRVGAPLLNGRLPAGDSPFAAVADLSVRARKALHKTLKNI